ncbi:hypothetical protein B296_00058792 [Ensete ventricosum]|uniref:C2H2-type domain-containing protein n=1 Tax=Ensete ventricosum TaxID=4639 RepID=A0A426WZR0_ENSVE|nr:hypothetical protein B296_00058792 [Ensete ventricosum]
MQDQKTYSEREGEGGKTMSTLWFTLKRSLHCRSDPSDVHEPKARGHLGTILSRKPSRSGCSRSIANLRDVIHGGRRQIERPSCCSPRSIGSSEVLNPIAHEVVLSESGCELKITGFRSHYEGGDGEVGSTFVGTLRPGTPGPGGWSTSLPNQLLADREGYPLWGSSLSNAVLGNVGANHAPLEARSSAGASTPTICHRCGDRFGKWEALEAHHQSKHAERVLKVHNMQNTLTQFEEYREMVKIRASKLPKKHPRCLADGNELLRFYGTTVCCSLGINGSSNLCTSGKCNVCRILRHGFSKRKEMKGGLGMFTASTSRRALESVQVLEDHPSIRKALLICRVIAGRVHKPMDKLQNLAGQYGFDSVAGKVGPYASIEELYLLNAQALLPCFVVICKP